MTTRQPLYRSSPALFICLLLALLAPAAHASVLITGQVVDADTGEPVPNVVLDLYPADVAIPSADLDHAPGGERLSLPPTPIPYNVTPPGPIQSCRCKANGTFLLQAPSPGRYEIAAASRPAEGYYVSDYLPTSRIINVPDASKLRLKVHAAPAVWLLLKGPNGKPAAGPIDCWLWTLSLSGRGHIDHFQRPVGVDGRLRIPAPPIENLRNGRSLIEIRSQSSGIAEIPVNGWYGPLRRIQLKPGGCIQGVAHNSAGGPLALARVYAKPIAAGGAVFLGGELSVTAGPDGKFMLCNLLPGEYEVDAGRASGEWVGPWTARVQSGAGRVAIAGHDPLEDLSGFLWGPDYDMASTYVIARLGLPNRYPVSAVIHVRRTGIPAAGIYVGLLPADANSYYHYYHTEPALIDAARTDAAGTVVLRAPWPGDYKIRVLVEPDSFTAVPVHIGRSAIPVVQIDAQPILHFHAVDADGKPIHPKSGNKIAAWIWGLEKDGSAAEWKASAWYTADGTISVYFSNDQIDAMQITEALVDVRIPGYGVGSARVARCTGDFHTLRMSPGAEIAGRVIGPEGGLGGSVPIEVWRLQGPGVPVAFNKVDEITTDAAGRFSMAHLFPGQYALVMKTGALPDNRFNRVVRLVETHNGSANSPQGADIPLDSSFSTPWWLRDLVLSHLPVSAAAVVAITKPEQLDSWLPVSGHVRDGSGGPDIAGALISLTRQTKDDSTEIVSTVLTSPDGSFTLRAVSAGSYVVSAEASGHVGYGRSVTVRPGTSQPILFTLPRTWSVPAVRFKLLGLDGQPIPVGIAIAAIPTIADEPGPPITPLPISGIDGAVVLSSVGPWEFGDPFIGAIDPPMDPHNYDGGLRPALYLTLVAKSTGIGVVNLPTWPSTVVTVRLQAPADLSGILIDSFGCPRSGVKLTLRSQGGTFRSSTDSDGHFAFRDLTLADCTLDLTLRSNDTKQLAIKLMGLHTNIVIAPLELTPPARNPESSQNLTPNPTAYEWPQESHSTEIYGRVMGQKSHKALPGALALLYDTNLPVAYGMALTAPDGSFRLPATKPGPYRIAIVYQGYLVQTVPVSVGKSPAPHLTIEANDNPVIRLRLIAPNGTALCGGLARVMVLTRSGTTLCQNSLSSGIDSRGSLDADIRVPFQIGGNVSLDLWVRVPGVGCAEFTLDRWPETPVPVQLQIGETLDVQVVDTNGAAVTYSRVTVTQTFGNNPDSGVPDSTATCNIDADTDANGRFHIIGLLHKRCSITVHGDDEDGFKDILPFAGSVRMVVHNHPIEDEDSP